MRTCKTVLAIAAALTASALAGEMNLSPIVPVAAVKGQNQFNPDVIHGPSTGSGQGKDGFLTVWQRSRGDGGRIECARLDASGKPLDAKPTVIAPDAIGQEVPRLAFGAGVYLVVWQDLRGGKELDIFAARVTPEGKVLDPGGFPVCQTPDASSRFPCAAFDPSTGSGQAGGSFIVIWSELASGNKGNYRLFSARVSSEGKAAAPQPLEIKYQGVGFGGEPGQLKDLVESDTAVCGNRLFVTSGGWEYTQVFALPDLKPVGPAEGWHPKLRPNGETQAHRMYTRRPTVATDGKSFLFSPWCGHAQDSAALINHATIECKVEEMPTFWGDGKLGLLAPALAFDGENYLFVRQRWSTEKKDGYGINSHLCARRVTPDGKPVGSADLDVAGTTEAQLNTMPRLASDGKGHVLMVWEQHPTTPDGNIVVATRLISTK